MPPSAHIIRAVGIAGLLLGTPSAFSWGQAIPTASTRFYAGVSAGVGALNTQLPYFADNAIGYSFGAFLQSSSRIGLEARAASYPVSATFQQAPVTAGIRLVSSRSPEAKVQMISYFGAGYSKAQDSSNGYKPLAAIWSPCWQVTQGMEIPLGFLTWRIYEAGWTETYTNRRSVPDRQLRSLSLTTSLVFTFGR